MSEVPNGKVGLTIIITQIFADIREDWKRII